MTNQLINQSYMRESSVLPVAPRALLLGHVLHAVVFVISYPPRYSIIQGEKLGERKKRENGGCGGKREEKEKRGG